MNTNISHIFFDLYGVLIDCQRGKLKKLPTVELLDILNKNYSLWIISNTSNEQINLFKKKYKFLNNFSGIITSESANYSKPDLRIFNYALNISNTYSESSIFIDDSLENTKVAEKLGFHTFHYSNYDQLKIFLKIKKVSV